MKRMIALLVALSMMLIPVFACADYASMSDDELQTALNLIRAEIVKRAEAKEGKQILAEADGITVTLKGEPMWKKSYNDTHYIELQVTVVNSSDEAVGIRENDTYVNGWKVDCDFSTNLEPGTKTKETIKMYKVDEDTDLECLDDLEDIKIIFLTFEGKTFHTKTKNIAATITY